MKKFIFILLIVIAIAGGAFYIHNSLGSDDSNQATIRTNEKTKNTTNENDEYRRIGDDTDSIVESNALLIQRIAELEKKNSTAINKINTLEQNQNNNSINNTSSTKPPLTISTVGGKVSDVVTNQNLPNFVSDLTDYTVGTFGHDKKNNDYTNQTNNDYIWLGKSIVSNITEENTKEIRTQNSKNENTLVDSFVDKNKEKSVPKFTFSENSIHNAINVTALVGRIPINGEVIDGYRFTLRIYGTSLFPNFHKHNNLSGAVLSGEAFGDLNRSCVRAKIDSITYIFDDGTISQNNSSSNDFATITDEYGDPCIKGTLETDVPEQIGINAGLGLLAGYASSIANAETTNFSNNEGDSSSSVTGNKERYYLANAGSSAIANIQEWYQDRANNSFDAIVVPAGQSLQVFFKEQVNIDYDPNGRKLVYKQNTKEGEYATFD